MKRRSLRFAAVTAAALAATTLASVGAATAARPVASPATKPAAGKNHAHHPNHGARVTIYLTRHGRTILNQTDTVQGWADSPLLIGNQQYATLVNGSVPSINAGRPLARTVGANLGKKVGRFDVAYSADGKRHFETATYMLQGARQKLSVTQDAGLREVNFGKYEGKENEEMWTDAVKELRSTVTNSNYVIDNSNGPRGCVTPGAGGNPCEAGGWQTMQGVAITEHGLYGMMDAIKEVADAPDLGLPAENCTEVNKRMTASLRAIAQKAAKKHQDTVLVVSSGLSINCFANNPDMRTVTGEIPAMPPAGVPNVGVTKVIYKKGGFAIDGEVGSTAYYPKS